MHKVGSKGQVVIDRQIRKELAIHPGWETIQRIVDGRLEITFLPPPKRGSLRGSLASFVRGPGEAGKDFSAIREEAWQQAIEDEAQT
jgi:hypothetical protein